MPITLTCQVSYQYKTEPDIDAITNPLERAKAIPQGGPLDLQVYR